VEGFALAGLHARLVLRMDLPNADSSTTPGEGQVTSAGGGARGGTRQTVRPPSLKRAVIQGVILAVLYFILIRFIWKDPGATTATYVIVPLVGFFMFTGVAYAVDRFTYQRRLRKLKGSSK